MKKSMAIVVVALCCMQSVMAKDLSARLSLGKHVTTNPHGIWSLEKKSANTKQLRAKILPKGEFDTYPCLEYVGSKGECWEIRIIDVTAFKKEFVAKNYYHFYWKKKKNKGYSDPNGEKINASMSAIPKVMLQVKNRSKLPVTLHSIQSKSIFQQGGTADSSEKRVLPQVRKGAMEISYNKSDRMTFPKGYTLPAGKEITLPLSLWVKDAASGDGTGDLAYGLVMHYTKGGKKRSEVLVNLLQGDAEGYDVTAGGIAPAN